MFLVLSDNLAPVQKPKVLNQKKMLRVSSLTSMAALLTACDFGGTDADKFSAPAAGTTNTSADYTIREGTDADDVFFGSADADLFISSLGADVLDGKGGIDKLDYSKSTSGVTVYLDGNTGTGGHAGFDQLLNIENVDGSEFSDTINDNAQANVINGLGGHDLFQSGLGADTINGGTGNDTMSYARSNTGVKAYLDGTAGVGGHAAGDKLSNIEILIGTPFADTLQGDRHDNTLKGGLGNNIFLSSYGADKFIGGLDIDTLDYSGSGQGVEAYLSGNEGAGGDAEGDTAEEIEHLTGSKFDDILHGNGENNIIRGLTGNDEINGAGGNDLIFGDEGNDKIDGGDGLLDVVDYSLSPEAVIVHLDGILVAGGHAQGDTLSLIEGVRGTAFDDNLYGDDNGNVLYGEGGNDQLTGNGGDDTIYGGAGNDSLQGNDGVDNLLGGAGDNVINGGNNIDTVLADFTALDYVIDKANNKIVITTTAGTDTLSSVEFITQLDSTGSVDIKTIWADLSGTQQGLFADEGAFLTWLGDDSGYNYDGI